MARIVNLRARPAPPGYRTENDARIDLSQSFESNGKTIKYSGPKRFKYDVALGYQPEECLGSLGVF